MMKRMSKVARRAAGAILAGAVVAGMVAGMVMPALAEELPAEETRAPEDMSIEDIDYAAAQAAMSEGGAYGLFVEKAGEYIGKYGNRELVQLPDSVQTQYYKGLCYLRMLDFNRDGQDELLLAYLDDDSNMQNGTATTISSNGVEWSQFWSGVFAARNYRVEVWAYKDGSISPVYTGTAASGVGGDTNGTYIGTQDLGNEICLVSGNAIMWGEDSQELLRFDGTSFVSTGMSPDSNAERQDYIMLQAYGNVPLADEYTGIADTAQLFVPAESSETSAEGPVLEGGPLSNEAYERMKAMEEYKNRKEAEEQSSADAEQSSADAAPASDTQGQYQAVIDAYTAFLHGGSFDISAFSADNRIIGEIEMARNAGSIENVVYYVFEDFDADGVDEMVIGFNDPIARPTVETGTENIPFFYSFLWKIVDGQPRVVDYKSMTRGSYLVRQGGIIIDQWGSGGDGSYSINVWDAAHANTIEELSGPWDGYQMAAQDVFARYPAYIFTGELHTVS